MDRQQLELKVRQYDLDDTSPIRVRVVCAVFRDILIPLLNSELRGRGVFGFIKNIGIAAVKAWLEDYVEHNCGV